MKKENGSPALTRGLEVLRVIAESTTPITSVEVATRVGLHQSWVSRVLKTLRIAGYVRKPDYHSFSTDYGVLALGGNALNQFSLVTKPRAILQKMADQHAGLNVALAILWKGQLIYLMRFQKGYEPIPLSVGFPLHLSSVGLRLLVDMSEMEALTWLTQSRQRYGWDQPTLLVPKSERAVLKFARSVLRQDCIVLESYYRSGLLGSAIPIEILGEPRAALAISAPMQQYSSEKILTLLKEGRRLVESVMTSKN
jgi:DNA-binding IclR family transcriptional regulator